VRLARDPLIGYLAGDILNQYLFQRAVFVDIGKLFDRMATILHCHVAQFYEGLPPNPVTACEVVCISY